MAPESLSPSHHRPAQARELACYYDAEAEIYEELWAPVLVRASEELLESLPLKTAGLVVDVGAGVGALLPAIQKRAPQARVIAVDRSPGMLQRAPQAYGRAMMDASALGFLSAIFDVAIMAFVLFHLPDPLRGLKETRRVLKAGGALGTLTWGKAANCPALDAFTSQLDSHHAHPDPCPPHHELVNDPTHINGLLEAAGFMWARSWVGWIEHKESRDSFIRRVSGGGPVRRRLESLDRASRRSCLSGAEEALASIGLEGFHTRRELVFATARVPQ